MPNSMNILMKPSDIMTKVIYLDHAYLLPENGKNVMKIHFWGNCDDTIASHFGNGKGKVLKILRTGMVEYT